jgi:hypothetical protein
MTKALVFVAITAFAVAAAACTWTQKAVSGGAVGGVAGFAIAGPIGAGVGVATGAIATPIVAP